MQKVSALFLNNSIVEYVPVEQAVRRQGFIYIYSASSNEFSTNLFNKTSQSPLGRSSFIRPDIFAHLHRYLHRDPRWNDIALSASIPLRRLRRSFLRPCGARRPWKPEVPPIRLLSRRAPCYQAAAKKCLLDRHGKIRSAGIPLAEHVCYLRNPSRPYRPTPLRRDSAAISLAVRTVRDKRNDVLRDDSSRHD